MIDPASQTRLRETIADCIGTDQGVLDYPFDGLVRPRLRRRLAGC